MLPSSIEVSSVRTANDCPGSVGGLYELHLCSSMAPLQDSVSVSAQNHTWALTEALLQHA